MSDEDRKGKRSEFNPPYTGNHQLEGMIPTEGVRESSSTTIGDIMFEITFTHWILYSTGYSIPITFP